MANLHRLVEELKRRHVWRVLIAYAAAGWLLVQIATQVFPYFYIPAWTVRLIVIAILVGLPVVVVWAWIYEITPHGVRRTEPADSPNARSAHERRSVRRWLDGAIIGVLIVAVGIMGWRLYVAAQRPSRSFTAIEAGTPTTPGRRGSASPHALLPAATVSADVPPWPDVFVEPAKSVAVLPFSHAGDDKTERFFADGLAEDLINALSQFADLKVISRNSAFQFRDSTDRADVIGRKLGVVHLLEGSVRRIATRVRVTASLVRADDGSVLWSQHYDRPYKELFDLQDAITQAVADALKIRLRVAPGVVIQSDRPPSGSLAAYAAYQRGVADTALNTEAGTRGAIDAFAQATRLDSRYANAYAQLATRWLELFIAWGAPAAAVDDHARNALEMALTLDPGSSLAHQARAEYLRTIAMDWDASEAEAWHALQLAPNDPDAMIMLANMLRRRGKIDQAIGLTRRALASNPRHALWYGWLSLGLAGKNQLDDARKAALTAIMLLPRGSTFHLRLASIEILDADADAALAAARQESNPVWREWGMTLALQVGRDREAADAALRRFVAKYDTTFAYSVAQVYALRDEPDAVFEWLDRAWTQRDPGIGLLLSDPFVLRFRKDPRFAVFCERAGLPVTTDAVLADGR